LVKSVKNNEEIRNKKREDLSLRKREKDPIQPLVLDTLNKESKSEGIMKRISTKNNKKNQWKKKIQADQKS